MLKAVAAAWDAGVGARALKTAAPARISVAGTLAALEGLEQVEQVKQLLAPEQAGH